MTAALIAAAGCGSSAVPGTAADGAPRSDPPGSQPPPAPPPMVLRGATVEVVGDSLTKASVDELTADLTAIGTVPTVSGINGQDIAQRWDSLMAAAGVDGSDGNDVVVAALGTNNAFFATLRDNRARSMDQSLLDLEAAVSFVLHGPDGAGTAVQCLVWVNVNDHTPNDGLSTWAPPFNRAVDAHARAEIAKGERMRVADWASALRGHPEYFLDDQIHLTKAGQVAYSGLIRAAVERCPGPQVP